MPKHGATSPHATRQRCTFSAPLPVCHAGPPVPAVSSSHPSHLAWNHTSITVKSSCKRIRAGCISGVRLPGCRRPGRHDKGLAWNIPRRQKKKEKRIVTSVSNSGKAAPAETNKYVVSSRGGWLGELWMSPDLLEGQEHPCCPPLLPRVSTDGRFKSLRGGRSSRSDVPSPLNKVRQTARGTSHSAVRNGGDSPSHGGDSRRIQRTYLLLPTTGAC